jgi:hypothetical protein
MAYNTQPGMTGDIASGGQYDNFDKVDSTEYSNLAANQVALAKAQAEAAAASAATASSQATTASNAATTATTQANLAAGSATQAGNYASSAANSADSAAASSGTASSAAVTATTAANTATDKAAEALASAIDAANSAATASSAASSVGTAVADAANSAAEAYTSAEYAEEMAQRAADHTRLEAGTITNTGVDGIYEVDIVGTPGNQVLSLKIPTQLGLRGPTSVIVSDTEPSTAELNAESTLKWFDLNTGVEYTWVEDGDSGQWVEVGGLRNEGSTSTAEETFETVSKNLKSFNFTLAYNGANKLSTLTYSNGIIKTLSYNGSGQLSTVVLSGSTPAGISLTKTLTYTSGKLTGIAYT